MADYTIAEAHVRVTDDLVPEVVSLLKGKGIKHKVVTNDSGWTAVRMRQVPGRWYLDRILPFTRSVTRD